MIAKSGNEFNAFIQVNAERRGVEFIFENDKALQPPDTRGRGTDTETD